MSHRLPILFLFIFISIAGFAQQGYKLDFKVKGLKDTTVYLGFYYWEGTFIKDTARVDKQGKASFEGKTPLSQGVYFLVLETKKEKSKLFDFVVGKDQQWVLETDVQDYKFKVTGDEDNQVFAENMDLQNSLQKQAEPFLKILKDSTLTPEQKKEANAEFKKIKDKVVAYQDDIITKYPNTITSKIFLTTKEIEVPDPPKKADGSIDSSFQFNYYRDHYFQYFDLADEVNIRLPRPFYRDKLYDYLDRLFIQHPDTLTKVVDRLAVKALKNQETYKYLVWKSMAHYQAPKIMGLDEVYVNIVDKYIGSGRLDYAVDATIKKNTVDYADKVRRAMIGRTAPNLMMQDQNLQPKSMYDIKKKYTILFIFSPDCGHCREETPKLVDFYNKNKTKLDLDVFAVSIDTSMKKMRDFAKEMKTTWTTVNGPRTYLKQTYNQLYFSETTPSLYIIDEKKKIIARKLGVADLPDFFEKHERFSKKQPNGNKGT